MQNTKKTKNIDQYNKTQKGNEFNVFSTGEFRKLEKRVPSYLFLEDEPKISETICGDYMSSSKCFLDHLGILVNDKTKQVLVLISDCTTTMRDRIYGKANNGIRVEFLKEKLREKVLGYYPNLSTYEMIYNCFVIFPDAVIGTYQNPEQEERAIDKGCAEVNYCTGAVSSDVNHHLLDGAFRIGQYIKCIEELYDDAKNGKRFNQWCLREKWREVYNTYNFMPTLNLMSNKTTQDVNFAKYCLGNRITEYSTEYMVDVLDNYGIPHSKNISKTKAVQLFSNFLDTL